jgi:hypothetical protein
VFTTGGTRPSHGKTTSHARNTAGAAPSSTRRLSTSGVTDGWFDGAAKAAINASAAFPSLKETIQKSVPRYSMPSGQPTRHAANG